MLDWIQIIALHCIGYFTLIGEIPVFGAIEIDSMRSGYDTFTTPSRRLLKRNYKPDEFEIPSSTNRNFLAEKVVKAFQNSADVLACPISTYACGNSDPDSNYGARSLGSCSIIASGSSILRYKYGEEIDSADTVIRIGFGPVHKFKEHVGSKTDILFVRTSRNALLNSHTSIKNDYTSLPFSLRDHLPSKFFIALPLSCQKNRFHGKSILKLKLLSHTRCNKIQDCGDNNEAESRFEDWYKGFSAEEDFINATKGFLEHLQLYRKNSADYLKKSELVFTHGFELILAMLHSDLCKTITTYGFSKLPTYHYFDNPAKKIGRRVRPGHVMGMEYFILEELQKNGFPIFLKAAI